MRQRIYERLSGSAAVKAMFGDPVRLHQAASLTEPPELDEVPLLVYHMGNESVALRGGDPEEEVPKIKYLQLWAHDFGGDYLRIDDGLDICRTVLETTPHEEEFLEARWIETSRDLRDPDLTTITKYARFILTTSR